MTSESKKLRKLIDGHGIPIRRLAPALGVTKQTLHNQLSGATPVSRAIMLALEYVPTDRLQELSEAATAAPP